VDIFQILVGDGLLSSEGEKWKFHRSLISPVFSPTNVSKLTDIMSEETQKYILKWKPSEIDGSFKIQNFTSELSKLTLRIIVACAFGEQDDDTFFDELSSIYEHLIADFSFISNHRFHF
jgi:cytochrome P450